MRIKTAIRGAVALSLISVILVAGLSISLTNELALLEARSKQVKEAYRSVSNLHILTQEFALYGESRASTQWHSQFKNIMNLLKPSPTFADGPTIPEVVNVANSLQESFFLLEKERWQDSKAYIQKKNLLLEKLLLNSQYLDDVIEQWDNTISQRRERAENNLETLSLSAPVLILFMLLMLAFLLYKKVLQPLDNFHQAVKAIAQGDLNARSGTTARDEFGELSRAFDEMAVDLVHELRNEIKVREQAEIKLKQAAAVFSNSQEGILITDSDANIIDVNPSFELITGYSKSEVLGKNPRMLSSGKHQPGFYKHMWEALKATGSWHGEIWNRHKSGNTYVELVYIDVVADENKQTDFYVAVFSDITRFKNHEKELHRIAHYDQLTALPNRRLLNDRLDQALAHADRNKQSMALCFLDLDGFKAINDEHGHAVGDKMLVHLTESLQKVLRKVDTLARLGGDEFVILLSELNADDELDKALQRILNIVNKPVEFDDNKLHISASIGATIYPNDNVDAESLLRHADQAMYSAKEAGKNRYCLYDPQHAQAVQAQYSYQQRLSAALKNEEFILHYQPKVNLLTGQVIGAEALIRWQHPDDGLLTPDKFLHFIEESPLEVPLSEWVLRTVFKEATSGVLSGYSLILSANLFARHLQSDEFLPFLMTLFEEFPTVNGHNIEFEILETQAFTNFEAAIHIINQCKQLGIRFSLDDFGTGYSSLTYLQRLPFDTLKIDQSFVINMLDDPNDLGIIDSVVRLAKAFDRNVIAEGVETTEHAASLVHLDCNFGQGFGIGYPMPATDFPAWYEHWHKSAIWSSFSTSALEK